MENSWSTEVNTEGREDSECKRESGSDWESRKKVTETET